MSFVIQGTKFLRCKSKTIKHSLDPSWRETFTLALTKGEYMEGEKKFDFGANGPILEVTVEDVDAMSAADFMGELNIPLETVEKKRTRAWYPLEADAKGKHKSSNVVGAVELILEWCYDLEMDFDPFMEPDEHPDKAPNEIRIGLARGRNLAVKDKARFRVDRTLSQLGISARTQPCPDGELDLARTVRFPAEATPPLVRLFASRARLRRDPARRRCSTVRDRPTRACVLPSATRSWRPSRPVKRRRCSPSGTRSSRYRSLRAPRTRSRPSSW